jgi:hypothetical protein
MATERQIIANKRNAKHSTGPRTLAGKKMSSRNSYKHGLSLALQPDRAMHDRMELLVRQPRAQLPRTNVWRPRLTSRQRTMTSVEHGRS